MKDEFYMKMIYLCKSGNYTFGIYLFGRFIDFRQWYYIFEDGVKSTSWFDTFELMHYIRYSKKKDLEKVYFEPIPKIHSMFFRK